MRDDPPVHMLDVDTGRVLCGANAPPGCGLIHGGILVATCQECIAASGEKASDYMERHD